MTSFLSKSINNAAFDFFFDIHSRKIEKLHFFNGKYEIHEARFKVLDTDNEPSRFQETLTNSTK